MMDLRTGSNAPWFNHPDSKARGLSLSASGTRIAEIHEEPAQPSRILTLAGNPVTNVTLIPLPAGLDWVSLFTPDERWLVTGGERIRFWDTATGKERPSPLPPEVSAKWMEFSPDGRRLLVRAFADSSLRVWNLDSGTPATPAIPSDHYNAPPAFSPNGDAVLSSRREGDLELELRKLSEPTRPLRVSVVSPIYAQAFHPSGRWIATGHWDGRVRLWSADTLEPLGTPLAIPDGVVTVAFSPDGTRLAASGFGREVRIWNFPEGRLATPPLRLGLASTRVAFSPDGRYLLGFGNSELLRIWDLHVPPPPTVPQQEKRLIQFDVSSRGAIAGTDRDGRGHLWEPVGSPGSQGFQYRTLETWPAAGRIHFGFDPAGDRIATFGTNAFVQLWSVATGKVLHEISHGHTAVTAVCFSPDSRHLVTVGEDDLVRRWDADRGTEIGPPLPHGAMVRDAAFNADSRRVATAGVDGLVRLWDLATGQPLGKPMRHDSEVARIRFSPDGSRLLASVGDDSPTAFYAQVWDATTGEPIGARMSHDDGVGDARFFPDGTRIFTAGEDGFGRVWDAATGKPRSVWMRCDRRITRIDLSPDGRTLATVDESARLRLWDADSGEPLTTPTPSGSVLGVRFLDAHRFVYAQLPGPIRLWELPMESAPRDELLDLARLSAGFEIDVAGGLSLIPPPEQQALFQRLQARDPARFRITSFAPEWHRQELDRALRTTNSFAEKFHRRALERHVPQ
jgi:WD40 repeat protein